jgi:hypothetical protein
VRRVLLVYKPGTEG